MVGSWGNWRCYCRISCIAFNGLGLRQYAQFLRRAECIHTVSCYPVADFLQSLVDISWTFGVAKSITHGADSRFGKVGLESVGLGDSRVIWGIGVIGNLAAQAE